MKSYYFSPSELGMVNGAVYRVKARVKNSETTSGYTDSILVAVTNGSLQEKLEKPKIAISAGDFVVIDKSGKSAACDIWTWFPGGGSN